MPEQISQLVAVVQADLKALNESVVQSAQNISEHSALIAQQTEIMQEMARSNERQTEVLDKMAAAFDLSVKTQLQVAQGQVPAAFIPLDTHERLMRWQARCFMLVIFVAIGLTKSDQLMGLLGRFV